MQTNLGSTLNLLFHTWTHISKRRRFQLYGLCLLTCLSGISEFLSLGSAFPFLLSLTDPSLVYDNNLIKQFLYLFGNLSQPHLILLMGIVFSAAQIISSSLRLSTIVYGYKLTASIGTDLATKAFSLTVYQPYITHLSRNSSVVVTGIVKHVGGTLAVISSVLQAIVSFVTATALLVTLAFIDYIIPLSAVIFFGTLYTITGSLVKSRLRSNSNRISLLSQSIYKTLYESLGGIRDLIMDASQPTYINQFTSYDRTQRLLIAQNDTLSIFPRYLFEGVSAVFLSILSIVFVSTTQNPNLIIPVLGSTALAAQKLLPALQTIYASWSQFKSQDAAMRGLLDLLNQPAPPKLTSIDHINFKKSLTLSQLGFTYSSDRSVLNSINLTVLPGQRIGIVGETGSGKSTLIDIIMGLLQPSFGDINIDGHSLHSSPDNVLAWRSMISHVPQNIFLADLSIKRNIAFGVEENEINDQKLIEAISRSCLSGVIDGLPDGIDTLVGERGVRLSGGQCQRLGIARALYEAKPLLILDEATSALDVSTESTVLNNIFSMSPAPTIFFVSHRPSTLNSCDIIIHIKNGTIYSVDSPSNHL